MARERDLVGKWNVTDGERKGWRDEEEWCDGGRGGAKRWGRMDKVRNRVGGDCF